VLVLVLVPVLGAGRILLKMPIVVTPAIVIADDALEERFVRASGPGGQNVNKVATAVQLRFDPLRSAVLTDEVRERLLAAAGSRVTEDGVIVIEARTHRTQAQNRDEARDRLTDLIRRALIQPKRRHKTRPTRAARQRRVEAKKRRAETKRTRRHYRDDD
jgi:ribosome-associated protein